MILGGWFRSYICSSWNWILAIFYPILWNFYFHQLKTCNWSLVKQHNWVSMLAVTDLFKCRWLGWVHWILAPPKAFNFLTTRADSRQICNFHKISKLILVNLNLQCTEEAHRPVDCSTVGKWILKNSAESENMNWYSLYDNFFLSLDYCVLWSDSWIPLLILSLPLSLSTFLLWGSVSNVIPFQYVQGFLHIKMCFFSFGPK